MNECGLVEYTRYNCSMLATSSLDFSEIITRYNFILEENIFLMLPFTILWLETWIHNLPFWGHSIFMITEFWPFLTTHPPLVNNLSYQKRVTYFMNANNWLTTHLPLFVYVVIECPPPTSFVVVPPAMISYQNWTLGWIHYQKFQS